MQHVISFLLSFSYTTLGVGFLALSFLVWAMWVTLRIRELGPVQADTRIWTFRQPRILQKVEAHGQVPSVREWLGLSRDPANPALARTVSDAPPARRLDA